MERILVPLDFSSCGPVTLAEALPFASAFGAGILLLHVAEAPRGLPLAARIHPPGAPGPVTVAEWLRADAERGLAKLRAQAEAAGVAADVAVETGRVAEAILAVAKRERVRMIVMGTHGREGIAHAMLGSVAEQVLRAADVPVVTIRTHHRPTCAARSCATCTEGRSAGEQALVAEVEG